MKPNELRLGNWVYGSEIAKFPMWVVQISSTDVCLNFKGNEGDAWEVDCGDVVAIPLTEELLLKCKFTKVGAFYLNRSVIISRHSGNTFCLQEMQVRSLHQLQNIYYALSGVELDIKL